MSQTHSLLGNADSEFVQWFTSSLANMGALSFDLHKKLAEEHEGHKRWGYSPSFGTSLEETLGGGDGTDWLRDGVSRSTAAVKTTQGGGNRPAWLRNRDALDVISDGSTTAQVDPLLLCRFLLESCIGRGVSLHQPARPISLTRSSSGAISSIEIINTSTQETKTLPCTNLVLAAGAWTPEVYRLLFPNSKVTIPITPLAGHSLVLQSPHWLPSRPNEENDNRLLRHECHAVFTTERETGYSPEIFSRMPDGHIYLAGLNSSTYPLPKVANESMVDQKSIAALKKTAHRLLGDDFVVVRESVCFRPVAKRGVPLVADLTESGEEGVYIAAGHGPWGISNSLGTGFCVAGMVEGRDVSKYVRHLGF